MKNLMSIGKSDYVNKKHIDKCDYANYNDRIVTKNVTEREVIIKCGFLKESGKK